MNDDLPTTLTDAEVWVLVGIVAIVIGVVAVFVYALLRTAHYPLSTTLVLALSMLTLIALVSFAITGSETLGTIAAAGVGALAGAVAQQFNKDDALSSSFRADAGASGASENDTSGHQEPSS